MQAPWARPGRQKCSGHLESVLGSKRGPSAHRDNIPLPPRGWCAPGRGWPSLAGCSHPVGPWGGPGGGGLAQLWG